LCLLVHKFRNLWILHLLKWPQHPIFEFLTLMSSSTNWVFGYYLVKVTLLLKYGFCKKLHTSIQMNLWPVEPFCPDFFSRSALHWSGKKRGQKGSTGQRFICMEVTSYKIHTLNLRIRTVSVDLQTLDQDFPDFYK
jgi:hypothetical protein